MTLHTGADRDHRVEQLMARQGFAEAFGNDGSPGALGNAYNVRVLDRTSGASVTYASSAANNLLWSYTVPQISTGKTGWIRTTITGFFRNESGIQGTIGLSIVIGGVTGWAANLLLASAADYRAWTLQFDLIANGDYDDNFLQGMFHLNGYPDTAITGRGGLSASEAGLIWRFSAGTTMDTGAQPLIAFYGQMDASHAAFTMERSYARAELLP